MKSLLAKLSPQRAIGVYIGDDEVALSQVVGTPLGPVEIRRQREKYRPGELPELLQRVLGPLVGKRHSLGKMVAFGLPMLRVFFSTRPLKASNVDVSPKVLLHEVLRSPNSNVDDMIVDSVQAAPGKRPVVSLTSCRKKYLTNLLAHIQECGVRPFRIEPAACALLRAAEEQYRAPRKAKTVLRLFLGDSEGLAVLSAGGWPVVPRSFKFATEDLSKVVVSLVRTLEAVGRLCGADSAIDVVMIHGRGEQRDSIDQAALQEQIGVKTVWHEGPSLDNGAIAFGLAIGCLKPNMQAFDLARSIKSRASVWEMFPWGEAALQVVVLVCLGLFLLNRSQELDTKYAAVRSETLGRHWLASRSDQQLAKEKQELEQRVESMRKFLATRIVWSAYAHDLPSQLPPNATLNSLYGICETEKKGKKDEAFKPKKSFIIRIGAPIDEKGAAPKEIDGVIDSLRGNELLKRDFPLVELADIKWFQPFVGAKPTAFFTVVCLPKPTGAGPGMSSPPAGDKAAKPKDH